MTLPLQTQVESMYEQDICSYCERIIASDGVHLCGPRHALLVHGRTGSTSHTRPTDAKGRLLVRPAASVLKENSAESRAETVERRRLLEDVWDREEAGMLDKIQRRGHGGIL